MEYYTAEKNDDILKVLGKWMDLENFILTEVTQTQKDTELQAIVNFSAWYRDLHLVH